MLNDPLFQPINIGSLTLPNRLIMAPMETNMAGPLGEVTPEMIAYYAERAAGGVAMVTVEFTCVDRTDGLACTPQLSLDSPHLIAGHGRLVDAIHAEGALACLQLHHAGRQTTPAFIEGRQPIAPSDFKSPVFRQAPRSMTEDDIERIITAFKNAAGYARSAGYDAIELHGAHGYLLGQFMSPLTNTRKDQWGGSAEKRLAFPVAVIKAVRKKIGSLPLIFRFSADEMFEGGLTLEDSVLMVPHLIDAGVDALHVSRGIAERLDANVEPIHMPDGCRLPLARRIRKAVNVPVIAVGVIRTPETARTAVANGDADIIALGRALLADPAWPSKAKSGQESKIRPCTSCNWCIDRLEHSKIIGCAENPATGRELELPLPNITQEKTAIVVGGGPGGMTAALLLDQAGFKTILYEKRAFLGGGLIASATPPGKDKIFRYRDYLVKQIGNSRVVVRLDHTPDASELIARNPHLVVIATGAVNKPLDIPGSSLPHVFQAYDLVMQDVRINDGPVVILGGGETGCEVAEMAADHGAEVVLISRSPSKLLARSAESIYRRHLIAKIQSNPRIKLIESATIRSITPEVVQILCADGTEMDIPARQILAALGRSTGSKIATMLEKQGINTVVIGDAAYINRIGEAVNSAYSAVSRHIKCTQNRALAC